MKTGILPQGKDLAEMTRPEVLTFLKTKSPTGLVNLILAILGHDPVKFRFSNGDTTDASTQRPRQSPQNPDSKEEG